MKLCVASVAVSLCLCGLAAAQARPRRQGVLSSVPPFVLKAFTAGHLRYAGVRTVSFRNAKKVDHTELVLHDGERTRVEFPEGSPLGGQVIVEDAKRRLQYFPKRNEIEVLPPRNDVTMIRLANFVRQSLNAGWKIVPGDGAYLAGVNTRQAVVLNKEGSVRQRLWIDPATGMILKRLLYDNSGNELAGFEFTSINYSPPIRPDSFTLNMAGAKIISPEMRARQLSRRNGFTPIILPASSGYRLESARMINVGGQMALSQLYSGADGKFSLFRLKTEIDPDRLRQMAQSRLKVYTWQRNGETFALVGEINEAKLQEVARQLGDR